MEELQKTINQIVKSIDWVRIKSIHKKLNILWEYEEDKEIVYRVPTVSELKEELRSVIHYMYENDLNNVSYENWIIFWDKPEDKVFGELRAIFRIFDYSFNETKSENPTEDLNEELKIALENEDYEYAALIRDELKRKKKYK